MPFTSPSAPRPACALAVLCLVSLGACRTAPPADRRVVHRLVDAAARAGAVVTPAELVTTAPERRADARSTAGLPTATLDGAESSTDTRPVLATHRRALLAYLAPTPVAADDTVALALDLDPSWPTVPGVVLATHARIDGTWRRLPATWAPVTSEAGRRHVRARVPAPGARAGDTVDVSVEAYLAPPEGRTSYRTAPIDVPSGAVLELAAGVLPPARDQGAVRFTVAACDGDACTEVFAADVDPGGARGTGWHDARVPLAAFAGARRVLRFETRQLAAAAGRYTLPVWADPVVSAPRDRPAGPSILLLSIDTLRADHLGTYGYARATSPFLDAFATRGVVFENLIAEAATTDPSHMTMFTSLPAPVHGATSGMLPLAVPVVTLAEALRSHGLRTAAFTEDGPLAHDRGFARGFDVYAENASPDLVSPDGHVTRTFGQARAWLAARPATPFFLFLHTFQVHAPYSPPLRYRVRFLADGDHVALPPADEAHRADAERQAANYDREIRFVDDELEELLGWMDDEGLLEGCIVVVLSDHGEEFYEHGALGHGVLPYEQVLRPPLVLVGPGVPPGRRVPQPVAHLDVMPTLLDLAGAPHPPALQGRSVAAEVRGTGPPDAEAATRALYSASWVLPPEIPAPAEAVRVGTRKLMRYTKDGRERIEYYDLASDPAEVRDLWPERAAEANDLRALLDRRPAELEALRRLVTDGGDAPAPAPVPLDPQREEKLRSLGYIR